MRFIMLLLLAVFAGCGSSFESRVSGEVTLDGEPLDSGTVSFFPVAGGPVAYGTIQSGGSYQLRIGENTGLPAGRYKVLVVAYELPLPEDEQTPSRLATPQQYASKETTPLEEQVSAGVQTIDLQLRR